MHQKYCTPVLTILFVDPCEPPLRIQTNCFDHLGRRHRDQSQDWNMSQTSSSGDWARPGVWQRTTGSSWSHSLTSRSLSSTSRSRLRTGSWWMLTPVTRYRKCLRMLLMMICPTLAVSVSSAQLSKLPVWRRKLRLRSEVCRRHNTWCSELGRWIFSLLSVCLKIYISISNNKNVQ